MKAVTFKQATNLLGQYQPEYNTLPTFVTGTDTPDVQEYTFKMELTDLEIAQILKTRSFFFTQVGSCFHPIRATLHNPLDNFATVDVLIEEEGYYQASVSSADRNVNILAADTPATLIEAIVDRFDNIDPDQIYLNYEQD